MTFILFMTCLFFSFGFLNGSLNDRLRYFETVHHDSLRHRITRRDVANQPHGRILEYHSHHRHFKLILHRDGDLLSSDFEAFEVREGNKQRIDVQHEFYRGFEESEPEVSRVTAYWESERLMSAAVETSSDTYILEPSHYHLARSNNYTLIAYRSSDIKPAEAGREMKCGNMLNFRLPTSHIISDGRRRHRRALPATGSCRHVTKKWCPLLLVADHRLHTALGHNQVTSTVHHLINQIMRVNEIYNPTVFGDCQDGFGFQIKQVIIHEKPSSGYNDDSDNWSYHQLLSQFAKDNRAILHNFCLSHLFTALPFDDSVMGLALNGTICDDNLSVSFTTYNRTKTDMVFTLEAALITAHELGHNWGSFHDISKSCVPSGAEGGKYLMYPYSVSGLDKNNRNFSSCSRFHIERCLKAKSSWCFTEKSHGNCGNFRIDEGEECDEVSTAMNSISCCNTATCKLKPGAVCSDQNSDCCTRCHIADSSKECYNGNKGCHKTTYCSGTSEHCPAPQLKPDGVPCYRGLCFNGECKTPCEYHNLSSCLCDRVEHSCKWCCVNMSAESRSCRPYEFAINSSLPDRTPCIQGYCVQGVCKRREAHTIRRILEFFKTIGNFEKFMRDNIVGTVLILSLIIWVPLVSMFQSFEKRQEMLEAERDRWLASSNKELISQEGRQQIKIIESKSIRRRRQ